MPKPKGWTKAELAGLLARVTRSSEVTHLSSKEKVILSVDRALFDAASSAAASTIAALDETNTHGIDTELLAVAKISDKVTGLRKQVLALFFNDAWRKVGMTNSEVYRFFAADYGRASIQPRTTDLQRMGLLRDSGRRRENNRGNDEIVWELTELAIQNQGKIFGSMT